MLVNENLRAISVSSSDTKMVNLSAYFSFLGSVKTVHIDATMMKRGEMHSTCNSEFYERQEPSNEVPVGLPRHGTRCLRVKQHYVKLRFSYIVFIT